jgi:hypothetical protein
MADISISPLAPRAFRVEVREGDRETTHQVTVPERLGEGLELSDGDLERVVGSPSASSSSANGPPPSWRSSRSARSSEPARSLSEVWGIQTGRVRVTS